MKRFVRNRVVMTVAIAWLAYWPVAYYVPQKILLELLNGVIASLAIGLVVAYLPSVWAATRRLPYRLTGADILVFGISLVQFSLAALFTWSWAYRVVNEPPWMMEHMARGSIIYMLLLGSAMHLLASDVGVTNDTIPGWGWRHLGIVVAAGLALAATLLSFVALP